MVEGPTETAKLFNARSPDEIVFGSSSTMNLENLTRGLENDIQPGDEFIITGEHEANAGPWKKLAKRRNAIIKVWNTRVLNPENPYSVSFAVEDLIPLISNKTRIVAFTACSNILGSIAPVKQIVQAIRSQAKTSGAKKVEISVDCVAYAPHRQIDVQDWDVDFCVFSFYKLYGPHISALYVRLSSLQNSITPLIHHFLQTYTNSYKLTPGGPGYELVYSTTGVVQYLLDLTPARDLRASWDAIAQQENTLVTRLLRYLTDPKQRARGVRVVGDESISPMRAPTISFVVVGERAIKSKDIVRVFDQKGGVGIRYGHFYAYTLVDELTPKLETDDGAVRISLVHYNTIQEVNRIIDIIDEILS